MFTAQMLQQMIRFYGHSLQGMMGEYLERNLQTFVELQKQFTNRGLGLGDGKSFTPEMWSQFLAGQSAAMQSMVGAYLEQSKNLFAQMQEQLAKQAGSLFPGMAGRSGAETER